MATIAERVARGAAWLDEREPGWHHRIDLGTLNVGSQCRCPLGQVYGGFLVGLDRLGMSLGNGDPDVDCGFMWGDDEGEGEIDALTAAWRTLIEARRADS